MNDDAVRVNQINLGAAIPSLRMLELPRLACSVQCLIPALLAFTVLAVLGRIFTVLPEQMAAGPLDAAPRPIQCMLIDADEILAHGFWAGVVPFCRITACFIVIGLTGTAISRSAGIQFCRNHRTGALRSLRHACLAWKSVLTSIGLTCVLGTISLFLLRLLTLTTFALRSTTDAGSVLNVPLWLSTLVMVVCWLAGYAGWLLSLAGIGVDSCNGPESLSRGVCYVLSRFWRTVCYLAAVVALTWLTTSALSLLVTYVGRVVFRSPGHALDAQQSFANSFELFHATLLETWKLSIFFCGVSVSYLLLRHSEDNTDLTEIEGGR